MNEQKKANSQSGNNAEGKIVADTFIRQVSVAGSHTNVSPNITASVQLEDPEDQVNATCDVYETLEKPKDSQRRKKGQISAIDYAAVFLNRNELKNRQGLYLSRENYEALQTLVRSIRSERLSVSGLVDNIVKHHIELYGDEINRIYEANSRRPIK